ncbi:hypothetical protein ACSSV1_003787 [Labrenzia sp. MBR-25]
MAWRFKRAEADKASNRGMGSPWWFQLEPRLGFPMSEIGRHFRHP